MADTTSSNPTIRVFQFDEDALGAVASSVNLFRGDVNLPLELVSLPGRNGMDVTLQLLGQSNVRRQVTQRNLEAPTSVLGAGWDLPIERITVGHNGSANGSNNVYDLAGDPMVATTLRWQRGVLDEGLKGALDSGKVNLAVQQGFAAWGVPLTLGSTISAAPSAGEGAAWWVADDTRQEVFVIEEAADALLVFDGGDAFESKAFNFWKIRYYERYDKWAVTRDNGITSTYGGRLASDGPPQSVGDSIQWGVRWGNWLGNSALTSEAAGMPAQQHYATAWSLATVYNVWGDTIRYDYDSVTQEVGAGGLAYTKAQYLAKVTDAFGRTLVFNYDDKRYDYESADGVREYADPHKPARQAFPNNAPNAYQDRYETRALTDVTLLNADGAPDFSIAFDYAFKNLSSYPTTDWVYGDLWKRYLVGVRMLTPKGKSLPGLLFSYCWEGDDTANRGALETVTYPQGGVVRYTYEQAELSTLNERSVRVERPFENATKPRVWFGSDYAVTTWYRDSATEPRLQVKIHSWLAGWYSDDVLTTWNFDESVDIDTLNVTATSDFCAVTYFSARYGGYRLQMFHKDDRALGQWLAYAPTGTTFGESTPTIAAGDRFFIIGYRDASLAYRMTRWTWNLQSHRWMERSLDSPHPASAGVGADEATTRYFATGTSNYYLSLRYDTTGSGNNEVQLFWHDLDGVWTAGATAQPNFVIASTGTDSEYIRFDPTATHVMLSVVTNWNGGAPNPVDYSTFVFQWDEDFAALSTISDKRHLEHFISDLGPSAGGAGLADFGPFMERYSGGPNLTSAWLSQALDVKFSNATGKTFRWYATGEDYVVNAANATSGVQAQLAVFDPNADVKTWGTAVQELYQSADPGDFRARRYVATSGGSDFFTFDNGLYARGDSTDWSDAQARRIYELGSELADPNWLVDQLTLQNQAPEFLAYTAIDTATSEPVATSVIVIDNGRVATDASGRVRSELLEGQFLYEPLDPVTGDVKRHNNGKLAAGPRAFYTTDTQDLDNASSLRLYRFADGAVTGALKDYRVASVTIDDGFDTRPTTFRYDDATASFDPSGSVAKYYKVTTLAGTDDASKPLEGFTETYYLNGHPQGPTFHDPEERVGDNSGQVYTMLDGLLQAKVIYDADGKAVDKISYDWKVFETVQTGQGQASLYGGWTRQTAQVQWRDGLSTTLTFDYDDSTGATTATETGNIYDGLGQATTNRETVRPGALDSAWAAFQNQLALPVQVHTIASDLVTSVVAMPLSAWTHSDESQPDAPLRIMVPRDRFAWRGGEDVPPEFPFDTWSPNGATPDGWLRQKHILAFSERGLVIASLDADGLAGSLLLDKDGRDVVATFVNGRVDEDEGDFYGFETYEQNRGWTYGGDGATVSSVAYAGTRSGALPSAGSSLTRSLKPTNGRQDYLFTAWYRTTSGYQPGDARWEVATDAGDTLTVELEATHQQWRQVFLRIPAPGRSMTLTASNNGAAAVYVDGLMTSPWLGSGIAQVYDTTYRLPITTLGPGNQSQRIVYDGFLRQRGSVYAGDALEAIQSPFLARQNDTEDWQTTPNHTLMLEPTLGGFYQDFRRDPDWERYWSSESAAWDVRDGALHHTTAGAAELSLRELPTPGSQALSVFVTPEEALRGPLGIRVGTSSVQWDPASEQWLLDLDGERSTSSAPWGEDWVLATGQRFIVFQVDGRRIFAAELPEAESAEGEVALFLTGRVAVSNILCGHAPRTSALFTDGTGRERQRQAIEERDLDGGVVVASLVKETLFDRLGRQAVETKSARLPATPTHPLLAYRSDFVSAFDWDTGVMQGEVASFYPADEGYPYGRRRYEASPLGRVVEEGQAGKAFAICDLSTTSPAQRHTTRITYGVNGADTFPPATKLPLPPGEYALITSVDPNNVVSYRLSDKIGGEVARGVALTAVEAGDETIAMSSRHTEVLAGGVQRSVTRKPNYYMTPPVEESSKFQDIQVFDGLGRLLSVTNSDSGTTAYGYDDAGRLLTLQDANGAKGMGDSGAYELYARYDGVGRQIEKGWRPVGAGDAGDAGEHWGKSYTYDGDGADPNLYGRLTTVRTRNDIDIDSDIHSDSRLVEERYGYDVRGNVVLKETSSADYQAGAPTALHYVYDPSGQVRALEVSASPAESGGDPQTLALGYAYTSIGQLASVVRVSSAKGSAAEMARGRGEVLCTALYNADGSIIEEVNNPGTAASVLRSLRYNSPGWLTEITDSVFSERIIYDEPATGRGYYNGSPAAISSAFGDLPDPPAGFLSEATVTYDYDRAYRLTEALLWVGGIQNTDGSVGADGNPVTYDDNSNFQDYCTGTDCESYVYRPGTDQVRNTLGTSRDDYRYDAVGNTIAAAPLGLDALSYDPLSNLTQQVMLRDGETQTLAYGGSGTRTLKTFAGARTFYGRDTSGATVVERKTDSSGDETILFYVFGPSGMSHIIEPERTLTIVKDHQGSTRAVVGPDGGVLSAYNYLPFGAPLGAVYRAPTETRPVTHYLYIGQELDPETGLYNLNARLYDPVLKRFLSPDMAGQQFSPYAYGFNDPLVFVDPSGNWSWAVFGMVVGAVAIAVVGAVVIAATAGAATPAVAASEVAVTSMFSTAVFAGIDAAATAAGAGILGSTIIAATATPIVVGAVSIAGGAILSAGVAGLGYAITAGDDANGADFAKALGKGALGGAVGGVVGVGAGLAAAPALTAIGKIGATSLLGKAGVFGLKTLAEAGVDAASGVASDAITSAILGDDITWEGLGTTAASDAVGSVVGSLGKAALKGTDPKTATGAKKAGAVALHFGTGLAQTAAKKATKQAIKGWNTESFLVGTLTSGFGKTLKQATKYPATFARKSVDNNVDPAVDEGGGEPDVPQDQVMRD